MQTLINKTLAQSKPSTDSLTLLYKVPANVHHTVITGINICNQDNANNAFSVTLAVNDAAFSANQYLYYNANVGNYGTTTAVVQSQLQPNDAIYVQSIAKSKGTQLLDADGGNTATVTITNGTANVVGTNTVFTAIANGATIRINGINKVINQITSDTSMNLTSTWTATTATNVYAYLPGYSNIVYNLTGIEYIQPPVVTSLSINSGDVSGGNTVIITGNNFFNVTSVKFGSKYATFTVTNTTSISANTPASSGAATINISVEADGGISKGSTNSEFTYTSVLSIPAPSITTLSSNTSSLAGGGNITITGNNFINVIGVRFGQIYSYSVTTNSKTQITAAVPQAFVANTVDVAVVSITGTSSTNSNTKFTYT